MLTMQSETKQCSDVIILNQKEINVFVYHSLLLSPWLLIKSFMSNPQCLYAATNLWMSGENSQLMLLHVRGWCDINMRRCHSFSDITDRLWMSRQRAGGRETEHDGSREKKEVEVLLLVFDFYQPLADRWKAPDQSTMKPLLIEVEAGGLWLKGPIIVNWVLQFGAVTSAEMECCTAVTWWHDKVKSRLLWYWYCLCFLRSLEW